MRFVLPCVTSLRQRNIDTARSTASANRSISSNVLYAPNDALTVPGIPSLSIKGSVQW